MFDMFYLNIANLCTKFVSSSFSRAWDMDGALKLKMGYVT